jgi:hypothetical protein
MTPLKLGDVLVHSSTSLLLFSRCRAWYFHRKRPRKLPASSRGEELAQTSRTQGNRI